MNIISFINQSKDTGKTTSVVNTGAALALEGKKVLMIDLDPQGELTKCMGRGELTYNPTIYELLKGKATTGETIMSNLGGSAPYDLIPCDIRLSGAEFEFEKLSDRELILSKKLSALTDTYDYILLDTSPNLNLFTLMALSASDLAVIPVAMEYAGDEIFPALSNWLDNVQKYINPRLELAFGIITKYTMESSFDEAVMDCIYERIVYSHAVQAFIINQSNVFKKQRYHTRDMFQFAPKSNAARMYKKIATTIINTKNGDWEIDIDDYNGWNPPKSFPDIEDEEGYKEIDLKKFLEAVNSDDEDALDMELPFT